MKDKMNIKNIMNRNKNNCEYYEYLRKKARVRNHHKNEMVKSRLQ